MPNNWKKYKLEEITEYINRGVSPSYNIEGIPVINQKCIRAGRIVNNDIKFHDLEKRKVVDEKFLKSFDILICSTGTGTLGRVGQLKEITSDQICDSHVTIVRPSKLTDKKFLGWYLRHLQPFIESLAEGSTGQTELGRDKVKNLEINLPPLPEQKAIAEILSSLDDKIELNLQTNKTLEEMANALYKNWFVDDCILDSELSDYIELNPKLSLKQGTIAPFVEMKSLSTNSSSVSEITFETFSSGSKFQNGDTLFARITPCLENGKTAFVDFLKSDEIGFGSTEFLVMRAKPQISNFMIYALSRDINFRKFAITTMVGTSGRQRVQNEPFLKYKLPSINLQKQKSFNTEVEQWFNIIRLNTIEIQTLKQTRDYLLPKLISGQIQVKDVAKKVKAIL